MILDIKREKKLLPIDFFVFIHRVVCKFHTTIYDPPTIQGSAWLH